MNDHRPLSPAEPPASSTIRNVSALLSAGWFAPASVQRSFEWGASYASRLLNDIDKVISRLHPEPEDAPAADHGSPDAAEAKADASTAGIAAPEDDFAIDEDAAETRMGQTATPEPPPAIYFIGNIILRAGPNNRYEIYDGLQRFTTLTILIAVLRDLIDDRAIQAELDHLVASKGTFRLHLFGRDRTLAEHVQAPRSTRIKHDNRAHYEIGRRILGVKNALRAQIEEWDELRRNRYARFLLESVFASVLDVRDARIARQMFVTTNLHGKLLDPVDVLKGQIADNVSQAMAPEAAEEFGKIWEGLKHVSGTAFREMLRAVDAIERTEPQDETWPTELGSHLPAAYPGADIQRFVRRLEAYTYGWKDCKRILACAGPSTIEQNFWRLHVFWWPEWHGLALRWWNQVRFARKKGRARDAGWRTLESKFDRLHRRCMAITLAQFEEADRQTIFMRAMRQDKDDRDVFRGALALNEKQRRKIDRLLRAQIHREEIWAPLIRWIEISDWRHELPEQLRGTNTEHVRPRRPDTVDDETESIRTYNEGCYALGNLAVISRKGNEEATNKEFADKLAVLRREATTFTTLRSVVYDPNGAERAHWTNAEIGVRSEMLRQKVWTLLGLKPPG